jgi:hypothetical protein
MYQDYKTSSFPSKEENNGEKLDFSPKGLLRYISSMGLEAYKTLATALQILFTLLVSVAFLQKNETDQIVSAVYNVTRQIHKPCYSFN